MMEVEENRKSKVKLQTCFENQVQSSRTTLENINNKVQKNVSF